MDDNSCCYIIVMEGIFFYIKNEKQYDPENVINAYYDAMDFKRFEEAHSYLAPECDITIAQFMLEISVTDGLLNSYAKNG